MNDLPDELILMIQNLVLPASNGHIWNCLRVTCKRLHWLSNNWVAYPVFREGRSLVRLFRPHLHYAATSSVLVRDPMAVVCVPWYGLIVVYREDSEWRLEPYPPLAEQSQFASDWTQGVSHIISLENPDENWARYRTAWRNASIPDPERNFTAPLIRALDGILFPAIIFVAALFGFRK